MSHRVQSIRTNSPSPISDLSEIQKGDGEHDASDESWRDSLMLQYTADDVQEELHQALRDIQYNGEDPASRFIARDAITDILNRENLLRLFAYLFKDHAHMEKLDSYVRKTLGTIQGDKQSPPRIMILALILYDTRTLSMNQFKKWLSGEFKSFNEFPSDENLPLKSKAEAKVLFRRDAQYFLDHQAIFFPVEIKEDNDHLYLDGEIPHRFRKPYVGKPEPLDSGASGSVYKVTVAKRYWVDEKHQQSRRNELEIHLAMKVFHKTKFMSAPSAAQAFDLEHEFLRKLKNERGGHRNIMMYLASIKEEGGSEGAVYTLFYDLAICNLDKFLTGSIVRDKQQEVADSPMTYKGKSQIIGNAGDLVGALFFLHKCFESSYYHFDIRPQNVLLVDEGGGREAWKLGDFDLSRSKMKHPLSVASLDISNASPETSSTATRRRGGLYQAPEIRQLGDHKAGWESDTWSIGCVLLLVFAFLDGHATSVEELKKALELKCRDGSTVVSFYMTVDHVDWTGSHQKFDPRTDLDLTETPAPASDLHRTTAHSANASVNPHVLRYLEDLCNRAKCRDDREGRLLAAVLKFLVDRVIVVDRKTRQRFDAGRIQRVLLTVRDEYQKYGQGAAPLRETEAGPRSSESPSRASGHAIHKSEERKSSSHSGTSRGNRNTTDGATSHTKICAASRAEDNLAQLAELAKGGHEEPNQCCLRCGEYPLHQMLGQRQSFKRDRILEALVKPPSCINVNIRGHESEQTPLKMALHYSGDYSALKILLTRPDLDVDESWLKRKRREMSTKVQRLIDDELKKRKKMRDRALGEM